MSPNHLLSLQQSGPDQGLAITGLPHSALPRQSGIDVPTVANATVDHHTPSERSHFTGNADFGGVGDDIDTSDDATGRRSQRGGVLADDERVARLSRQELLEKKDWRMLLILEVIMKWAHPFSLGVAHACLRIQELWCRIIEGDSGEDFWIWVDGDEEWLRRRQPGAMLWSSANLRDIDWDRAQLALRRRLSQQRYPPAIGPHGDRNERVRNATHEQRFSAIVWLLSSCKGVAELTTQHGYTPPTFRISKMASILGSMVGSCWDAFPAQTKAWEKALLSTEKDGCTCLRACRGSLRTWFDMLVWLDGLPPPMEGIDDESCIRCRTLVQLRYDDLANNGVARLKSQLWHVMCYHAIRTTRRDNAELLASSAKRISKAGREMVERTLNPVLKRSQIDLAFTPRINEYPKELRFSAAQMSCILPPDTQLDTPRSVQLPDSVLEDARDPWIMLGIIAWMCAYCRSGFAESACEDRHDELWHSHYLDYASEFAEFFQIPEPVPKLPAVGIELYHQLRVNKSESGPLLSQFGSDRRQWCLTVYVAVAIFLGSRDVSLPGCPRCRVLFETSCANGSATLGVVARSGGSNSHLSLSPSILPMDDVDDIQVDTSPSPLPSENGLLLRPWLARGSPADLANGDKQAADKFSPFQRSDLPIFGPTANHSEACLHEPTGMEAFTSITRDKALSPNEMQSRLTQQFLGLTQYVNSLGLDASTCFRGPGGDNVPHPESSVEKPLAGGIPREPLSDPPRLTKSDMIEEIKDKFLEMLRELDIPCDRLPWSTLEKELEKYGFVLVNWPAGVIRKRSNKGFSDLSTVDVNLLYQAIMHSDEACRLRICRRSSEFTVNHTGSNSSNSKRSMQCNDSDGHPPKRLRYKEDNSTPCLT